MAITRQQIEKWFDDRSKPRIPEDSRVAEIQIAAKRLATVIADNTPASADQSVAIRKVRESRDAALQAIAYND